MTTLNDDADRFTAHPAQALAALLPDHEHVDRLIRALSGGIDAGTLVEVLHGQAGLRVLDRRGAGRGVSSWLRRLLLNWTYYDQFLRLYGEELLSGDFLTVIPCDPGDRREIAAAALSHGGRSVYYFGFDTVERMPGTGPRLRAGGRP